MDGMDLWVVDEATTDDYDASELKNMATDRSSVRSQELPSGGVI